MESFHNILHYSTEVVALKAIPSNTSHITLYNNFSEASLNLKT